MEGRGSGGRAEAVGGRKGGRPHRQADGRGEKPACWEKACLSPPLHLPASLLGRHLCNAKSSLTPLCAILHVNGRRNFSFSLTSLHPLCKLLTNITRTCSLSAHATLSSLCSLRRRRSLPLLLSTCAEELTCSSLDEENGGSWRALWWHCSSRRASRLSTPLSVRHFRAVKAGGRRGRGGPSPASLSVGALLTRGGFCSAYNASTRT